MKKKIYIAFSILQNIGPLSEMSGCKGMLSSPSDLDRLLFVERAMQQSKLFSEMCLDFAR